MNKSTPSIEAILARAVEIATSVDRQAYVEQACGGDTEMQRRVERLIANHFQAGSFLEHPAVALDANGNSSEEMTGATYASGTVIGPYKLLEQIGEGGMGLVFAAEQQAPIKRRVALKIIKPGMDTRQVIARFEAERQALAMMDHPNIAKILDAGTTDGRRSGLASSAEEATKRAASFTEGRPFFVMELVKGTPITEYCDAHRLATRQRLQLFLDVCHAVQHAHQKGIIHRDLKPSNVLVSHHDVRAVVKVIDFGVAKAIGERLTYVTIYTGFDQMLGTPLYMSPEQAGLSDLDVDTRSDVYALGVLLYELLTGTTPFDGETVKKVGYDEMRRIIREEDPPQPSTRLSTMQQAALSTIAERRGLEPHRLRQHLRGELDWIVMKALEKDRDRRYESASAFATDVQRYLSGDVVEACPPSAGYRLRKYVSRNRTRMVVWGSAFGVVFVGVLSLAIGSFFVWREKEQTKLENVRAQQNLDRAYEVLDDLYLEQFGKRLADQEQLSEEDRRFLQRMVGFYQEFAAGNSSAPKTRLKMADAYQRIADIQFAVDDFDSAKNAGEHAMQILEELAKEFPHATDYRLELARAHYHLGLSVMQCGRLEQAREALLETRKACELALRDFPDNLSFTKLLASAQFYFGATAFLAGDLPQAKEAIRDAISISKALLQSAPDDRSYRVSPGVRCHTMCRVLIEMHRLDKAEATYRTMFALYDEPRGEVGFSEDNDAARIAEIHNGLGLIAYRTGRVDEGRAQFQRALSLLRLQSHAGGMRFPPYNRRVQADAHLGMGLVLLAAHRAGDAITHLRAALQIAEKMPKHWPWDMDQSSLLAEIQFQLGKALLAEEDRDGAQAAYQRAGDLWVKTIAEHPHRAGDHSNLGAVLDQQAGLLRDQGKAEEAGRLLARAGAQHQAAQEAYANHPLYRQLRDEHERILADALQATPKVKEAVPGPK
jgi:serine/threonine protein kinase